MKSKKVKSQKDTVTVFQHIQTLILNPQTQITIFIKQVSNKQYVGEKSNKLISALQAVATDSSVIG